MSKQSTSVYVLHNGNAGKAIAEDLVRAIREHRERKEIKGRVIAALDSKEAIPVVAGIKDPLKVTLIALQIDKDPIDSEERVAKTFRVPRAGSNFSSSVSLKTLEAKAGQQSFSIILQAPDEERLSRAMRVLMESSARDYKQMDFYKQFRSNKLIVHTNGRAQGWGTSGSADVWDFVEVTDLSGKPIDKSEDPEYEHVYIVDRSKPCDGLPEAVLSHLRSADVKPNATYCRRHTPEGEKPFGVITAPNDRLLSVALNRFRSSGSLPPSAHVSEVPDLRFLSKENSVVILDIAGTDPSRAGEASNEAVRAYLSQQMRTQGLPVLERGPVLDKLRNEITLQQLLGSTDTRKKLRSDGARYVWYMSVTKAEGRTEYKGGTRRVSAETSRPPDPAP